MPFIVPSSPTSISPQSSSSLSMPEILIAIPDSLANYKMDGSPSQVLPNGTLYQEPNAVNYESILDDLVRGQILPRRKSSVYECKDCSKFFTSKLQLHKHIRTTHDESFKPYSCLADGCTKRFTRKDNMQQHYYMKHTKFSISS